MNGPKIAPAQIVVAYFACFALAWVVLAVSLFDAKVSEVAAASPRGAFAGGAAIGPVLALSIHAALVAVLAWKAQRLVFAHGILAVILSGLPLLLLLRQLWFVPAFVYLIAVLHVWLASRHESLGQLQTTHRHSNGNV